ncbi:glutaminyl-peptide cyclotransferase [Flavobacterium sp.]|uniref:glutaminyl-peptide cyclotransferase n=1 Tax=Flavobacterium sp. TaxID=239 RepID=UPI00260FC408|nr:glutaminyl-peptide cyclotransferase [Flavobacterium sp.]
MKNYKVLAVILLAGITFSCKTTDEDFFTINESKIKAQYTTEDLLNLEIANPKTQKIDSVVYSINEKKVGSSKSNASFSFPLKDQKLGYHNVKASIYYGGATELDSTRIEVISNLEPKILKFTLVNTYPHDNKAYTQGLEFYKGVLYEGTGQRGESTLRKTNYKTGSIDLKIDLEPRYFGEGITFLNDKIYQLTWEETTAFVYDANTLKKLKDLPYSKNIEGWGLTNDGKNLYQTDGTEKIYKLNPDDLKVMDYVNVYSKDIKVKALNELEWVDGKIFSNIYQKNVVVVVNPTNGVVEGVLNLAELESKTTPLPERDVLNGIAYNPATKTFFVTGKNWDKMFEIKITGL